jgi:hypothetical protein
MITHHPGTVRGDDTLARYDEAQTLTMQADQLASDRARFEPVKVYDDAHADHLADVADLASQRVVKLGEQLRCYIGTRNDCERYELDDDLRIVAQRKIDELMPLYEAAKVEHLAARNESLKYRCGV